MWIEGGKRKKKLLKTSVEFPLGVSGTSMPKLSFAPTGPVLVRQAVDLPRRQHGALQKGPVMASRPEGPAQGVDHTRALEIMAKERNANCPNCAEMLPTTFDSRSPFFACSIFSH